MINTWDPFAVFDRLHPDAFASARSRIEPAYRPRADVRESAEAFLIDIELPGVASEDLRLEVEDGVLKVSAERKAEDEEGWRLRERHIGPLERRFRLGGAIQEDGIEARFEHGVLRVTLPKRARRRVEIQTN